MPTTANNPDENPEGLMSFGEHLDELRTRLIYALAFPLPVAVVAFFFSHTLLDWLLLPVKDALERNGLPVRLQVLYPAETIIMQLKVSVILALVLACPWILYQLWLFVRPGLMAPERRFIYLLLPGSAVLTVSGVALMYFVMLPLMLSVLIGIGQSFGQRTRDPRVEELLRDGVNVQLYHEQIPDDAEPDTLWLRWPSMELYAVVPDSKGNPAPIWVPRSLLAQEFQIKPTINFVLLLFLAIVVAFQMPLVMVLLGWVGLADVAWLRKQRKYAVLVLAVVSAIITPADAISMLMMVVPLYGLYELGILLMVLAPASKVAEGSVFRSHSTESDRSETDKPRRESEYVRKPVQSESSVPRQSPESDQPDQSRGPSTDDEEDRT